MVELFSGKLMERLPIMFVFLCALVLTMNDKQIRSIYLGGFSIMLADVCLFLHHYSLSVVFGGLGAIIPLIGIIILRDKETLEMKA